MAEKFEVTLIGNDQLGGMIDNVNDKVKDLSSSAEKAAQGLGNDLAGKDNQSGVDALEKKFSALAMSAKQNVQHIGDMVPPLKTFGELAGKYLGNLGKFGLTGGVIYGVSQMASSMVDLAAGAHKLETSAKNIGLNAEQLSMVLGAFKFAGIEEAPAIQSLNAISDAFNDIFRGGDSGNRLMSQLEQMGLKRDMIPSRVDDYGNETVIVDELLPILERIYDNIQNPQIRHEFARNAGIDASMEQLFNNNFTVLENYQRAYSAGLVLQEETNRRLVDLNSSLTDTSAYFAGWWNKTKLNLLSPLMGDEGDGFIQSVNRGFENSEGLTWQDIVDRANPFTGVFNSAKGIYDFFNPAQNADTEALTPSLAHYQSSFTPRITQPMMQADFYEKVFLDFIAMMEGTYGRGDDGYNVSFGGKTFNNGLAYHPNIQQPFMQTDGRMNTSGAAGRYQFINRTWGGLSNQLGLTDFSKEAQDRGALELIRQNGALDAVRSGNWQQAVGRLGNEWASFPSSGHPQNHRSWQQTEQMWNRALEINSNKPIAQDIAEAINQNPTQITLRIENGRQTQTVSTQAGATISTSMDF